MVVPELGIQDTGSALRSANAVEEVAYRLLCEAAQEQGLVAAGVIPDVETISVEDFPVVDGWQSMERIITVKVQLKRGERLCGIIRTVTGYVTESCRLVQ